MFGQADRSNFNYNTDVATILFIFKINKAIYIKDALIFLPYSSCIVIVIIITTTIIS